MKNLEEFSGDTKSQKISIDDLASIGLPVDANDDSYIEYINTIPGISIDRIKKRIEFLKSLGMTGVMSNIVSYARQTIMSSEQQILDHIAFLETLTGTKKAIKIFSNQPQLFIVDKEKLQKRYELLQELGFSNATNIIEKSPSILGVNSKTITGKIGFMKDLGVEDPVRLINAKPETLGLGEDNIRERYSELSNVFPGLNISEIIKKCPAIFTYPTKLLIKRRKIVDRASEIYSVPLEVKNDLLQNNPQTLTLSTERIFLQIRILAEYKIDPEDALVFFRTLSLLNAEDILVSYIEDKEKDNIKSLFKESRLLKCIYQNLENSEKELWKEYQREIIDDELAGTKIKRIVEKYFYNKENKTKRI